MSHFAFAQSSGKDIFQTRCVACHRIGGGRLVGPDLAGVNERRTEKWLLKFVMSSQSVIQSGDPDAVALFEEFNKMIMPDNPLSDSEIKSVLAYIKESSAETTPSLEADQIQEEIPVTHEAIVEGQDLFQGKIRFSRGGPSCISCHHVKNDAVIGGGILAKDLTTVFSRLGGQGVRTILGQPPFPVMQQAYMEKPLTDEEVHSLISFLKDSDEKHFFQKPRDYGVRLAVSGVIGMFILMGLYSLVWFRRKKESVNQSIFNRQVKSTSDENDL